MTELRALGLRGYAFCLLSHLCVPWYCLTSFMHSHQGLHQTCAAHGPCLCTCFLLELLPRLSEMMDCKVSDGINFPFQVGCAQDFITAAEDKIGQSPTEILLTTAA